MYATHLRGGRLTGLKDKFSWRLVLENENLVSFRFVSSSKRSCSILGLSLLWFDTSLNQDPNADSETAESIVGFYYNIILSWGWWVATRFQAGWWPEMRGLRQAGWLRKWLECKQVVSLGVRQRIRRECRRNEDLNTEESEDEEVTTWSCVLHYYHCSWRNNLPMTAGRTVVLVLMVMSWLDASEQMGVKPSWVHTRNDDAGRQSPKLSSQCVTLGLFVKSQCDTKQTRNKRWLSITLSFTPD